MHSASWIVTPVWRHAQEQYNTDCYVRHDRNSTAIGYHAFSVSVLERRFTMLAIKKLNNNAVLCRDGQGRDVIAMGRGVGFGGDFPRELPLSKIEHTFYDIDPKGQDVMRDLPSDIVMFAAKVMDIVANELPYDLSTNATLFMADHLSFAVARAQRGSASRCLLPMKCGRRIRRNTRLPSLSSCDSRRSSESGFPRMRLPVLR